MTFPPSLDNVCAEPNPSDSRYLEGLHKMYGRHQDFPRTQPRDVVRTIDAPQLNKTDGRNPSMSSVDGKCHERVLGGLV